ncbi:S1C family serine protease [Aliirhizobium terrae]|uniref:S1C family serine protease n=1 Tax=Terrirhizobium terrae TaxID=2926709 RepID=UPI0025769D62|nr:S1C family serine protease [Rhizobium sp. CC-CFT758]WJH41242.1 S1C family serine protease [Rhizobium sp. CC-CFT758]
MRLFLLFVCLYSILPDSLFASDAMQRTVVKLFKRAIVKIDVSGRVPQFDSGGIDQCQSQGMGFLVSRSLIISARHVIDTPAVCDKVIRASSASATFQSIADEASSLGDIVLLKLRGSDAPNSMCALAIADKSVVNETVVRFAMPAPLVDPAALLTELDDLGQFAPNVRFSPAPVHNGDSGGPLVHMFSVVGLTKEKLTQVDGYGVMIPVEPIIRLLRAANFAPDGSLCNPLEMAASPFGATFSSEIYTADQLEDGLNSTIIGASIIVPGGGAPFGENNSLIPSLRDNSHHGPFGGGGHLGDLQLNLPPRNPTISAPSDNPYSTSVWKNSDGKSVSVNISPDFRQSGIEAEFFEKSLTSQLWRDFTTSLRTEAVAQP